MISIITTSSVVRDTLNTITQFIAVQWQDILSILAAIFSALLVYVAWTTLREHNRPYVTLYAETGNRGVINLVLKNSGNRAAYNVKVCTDFPMESAFFAEYPENKFPLVIEKSHPFIGPDQIVSGIFDYLSMRYNRGSENYKEPHDQYTVTIKYRHKKRRFVDKYQLDLSYLEFMPRGYSRDHIGDISRSLRKISDQLPGGRNHAIRTMLKNASNKSQSNNKRQSGEGNTTAKDIENEPK